MFVLSAARVIAMLSALAGLLPACQICQPGKVHECVYLKGKCEGKPVQQCNKEGTQWEPCRCPTDAEGTK